MHTPEFDFEKDAGNVERAIGQNDLGYPVVQDNEFGTWKAWGNQYWPAKYLVDARGRVRYAHFGEGEYDETEAAIRSLLDEAGAQPARPPRTRAGPRRPRADLSDPRDLPRVRARRGLPPRRPVAGHAHATRAPSSLPLDHFALRGTLDRRPAVRDVAGAARRCASASARGASSWCWARQDGSSAPRAGAARRPPDPSRRWRERTSATAS